MTYRRWHLAFGALALLGCAGVDDGTSGSETAQNCTESTLIDQCPPGSSPILGATAEAECQQSGGFDVLDSEGAVTGRCAGFGTCTVLCQFDIPCECGVASITREGGVDCSDCSEQAACGNDICEGTESFETCPEDCAGECVPGNQRCIGSDRQECNFNAEWETFACPANEVCVEDGGITRCERDDLNRPDAGSDVSVDTGPEVAGRILFGVGSYPGDDGVSLDGDARSFAQAASFAFVPSCPAFTPDPNCQAELRTYPVTNTLETILDMLPLDERVALVRDRSVLYLTPTGVPSSANPAPSHDEWCDAWSRCPEGAPVNCDLDDAERVNSAYDAALESLGPDGLRCVVARLLDACADTTTCIDEGFEGTPLTTEAMLERAPTQATQTRRTFFFETNGNNDRWTSDQRALYLLDPATAEIDEFTNSENLYGFELAESVTGRHVAVATWDGTPGRSEAGYRTLAFGDALFTIYDTETGDVTRVLPDTSAGVPASAQINGMALSPNGTILAVVRETGSGGNRRSFGTDLYNVETGEMIYRILPPGENDTCPRYGFTRNPRFLPDGRSLLLVSTDCEGETIEVWDTSEGVQTTVIAPTTSTNQDPDAMVVSPDGSTLLFGYSEADSGFIDIYDLESGERIDVLTIDSGHLLVRNYPDLRLSPEGTRLLSSWFAYSESEMLGRTLVVTMEDVE